MREGLEIADRYRLEERVGEGGMGDVWRAHDRKLKRPVAIKILRSFLNSNPEHRRRLRREAEIAANLKHPGITVVHDFGEHGKQLFIVMEWLEGSTLRDILDREEDGVSIARVLSWGRQLADALSYAHQRKIVHRDIKPANLILLSEDRVKICDFGIAKSAEVTTGLTPAGGPLGTPAYMAPEQCRGDEVDGRTDLYALGCVLYALLTGDPPFSVVGLPYEVMQRHLYKAPWPPKDIRAEIPSDLNDLVLRLLAKNPGDRPTDATTVSRCLGAIAANTPSAVASTEGRQDQRTTDPKTGIAAVTRAEPSGEFAEPIIDVGLRAYVRQLGMTPRECTGEPAGTTSGKSLRAPSSDRSGEANRRQVVDTGKNADHARAETNAPASRSPATADLMHIAAPDRVVAVEPQAKPQERRADPSRRPAAIAAEPNPKDLQLQFRKEAPGRIKQSVIRWWAWLRKTEPREQPKYFPPPVPRRAESKRTRGPKTDQELMTRALITASYFSHNRNVGMASHYDNEAYRIWSRMQDARHRNH